jgi:hypothetical protein
MNTFRHAYGFFRSIAHPAASSFDSAFRTGPSQAKQA